MNQLEQSKSYLRQYLQARRATPWIVAQHPSIEDRAVDIHAYVDSMDTAQIISTGILRRYGVEL